MDIQFNTPVQELKPYEITPQQIKEACCEAFGIKQEEVDDRRNEARHVCWARHAAWFLEWKIKRKGYKAIADDHDLSKSTVQFGIQAIQKLIRENSFIREAVLHSGHLMRGTELVRGFIREVSEAA
jgi:chromosomal replication initiation ATPase DnaA